MGLDHYYKPFESWTQWGRDPVAAFEKGRTAPYGLEYVAKVAGQLKKPIALSEVGWQPSRDGGKEEIDTRPYAQRMLAWVNSHNVENFLYWNGFSNEGFLGEVVDNGKWPKHFEGVKAVLNGIGGTFSIDGQADQPQPIPQQPEAQQPPQPADPVLDLLDGINPAAFAARGRYPEPTNGLIRQVEHMTWVAQVGSGRKAGSAPAGEETNPTKVALAVYGLLANHQPLDAGASALIEGWLRGLEALLDGQLPEAETPDLVTPEPAPEPSDEVAELRAQVARLQGQLATAQAALAAIRAALPPG